MYFQEYDTLDSSNSGGKTSFDSAGSRNVPEKRSRKLERPKSLTNLVWDFRSGGGTLMQRSNSKPSILVGGTGDRKMLDHGAGFTKRRFSKDYSPAGCNPAGKRMGSNKMATLYLWASLRVINAMVSATNLFHFIQCKVKARKWSISVKNQFKSSWFTSRSLKCWELVQDHFN